MAEQPPRAVAAMDPPHITEFASERYFEKLSQLNATQQHQHQDVQHHEPQLEPAETSSAASTAAAVVPSTFILPLRETKSVDPEPAAKQAEQKRDKSRFFSIRQKVSLLHSKPHATDVEVPTPFVRPSTEAIRKRCVTHRH